jgi:hypothetical protein
MATRTERESISPASGNIGADLEGARHLFRQNIACGIRTAASAYCRSGISHF